MSEEVDIPVSDNFEPAPGIEYDDEPVEQTEEPKEEIQEEPEEAPEPTEEPAEEAVEEEKPSEPEKPQVSRKPKPIAALLEKKHDLETQLAEKDKALAELSKKLESVSEAPKSATSDDELKALAEEYGVDEAFLTKVVDAARKSANPELPEEVKALIEERQQEKQMQEEMKAFESRIDRLSAVFKDEPIAEHRDKLLELAYSTDKAPDGEEYYKKELSELYFGYVKPEIEPGVETAESTQAASPKTEIIDFEEIFSRDDPSDIERMDSETFHKYNSWVKENKERPTPIKRS